jgi:hypothetical protein
MRVEIAQFQWKDFNTFANAVPSHLDAEIIQRGEYHPDSTWTVVIGTSEELSLTRMLRENNADLLPGDVLDRLDRPALRTGRRSRKLTNTSY